MDEALFKFIISPPCRPHSLFLFHFSPRQRPSNILCLGLATLFAGSMQHEHVGTLLKKLLRMQRNFCLSRLYLLLFTVLENKAEKLKIQEPK